MIETTTLARPRDERQGLLARLDQARAMLAEARTLDDIRQIRDVAEAARAYAQAARLGAEAIGHATAIKLDAERKAGEMLRATPKHTGGRPSETGRRSGPVSRSPKLDDLGVSKQQSSDWQALARLDEVEYQAVVEEAKDEGTVSTAAVVKKARQRKAKAGYAERAARPKPAPAALEIAVVLGVADALALPLAAESVDLIVTSPPYALAVEYDSGDIEAAAWPSFMQAWLAEALRVTKPRGRLALNVPLDTSEPVERATYAEAIRAALAAGWAYKFTVVWNEGNTTKGGRSLGSVNSAARPHHVSPAEMVAVFFKAEWGPTSDGQDDILAEEWQEWGKTVWAFSGESRRWEAHPAPFPEELPRRLIKYLSRIGDTVLDPFCGSGTTVLAAWRLQRQPIGFDISEAYIQSARRRLAAAASRETAA